MSSFKAQLAQLGVEGYDTVPEEILPRPELTDSLKAKVRKIARVVAAGKSVAGAPGQERDPECLAAKPFTRYGKQLGTRSHCQSGKMRKKHLADGSQDLTGNDMAEYRALRKTQAIARKIADNAQREFERSGRQH
ncbi:hypothetical protein PAAG_11317 [Paracoccidioides lutzii Pb01]|uniref:Uncharacterized protein n=1 Tax=Paracoccidioides lutzii (strain ATCC MYA-826 / Pb01) TaxID=502779 RepID=A0A0A2V294_PARBA|nr:hypothetical protein PAAG_11317 [Paracoccidioides lutzii Pb01]KGQ01926.1 hypothetical protein PAAG_11317 [Paracoccidioides lutzii Pb01]